MTKKRPIPRVFISSTVSDLKAYRDSAATAARAAGFLAVLCEDWAARDVKPPLAECLSEVEGADVVLTIVAHRCGWVPVGPSAEARSITRLECEHAEEIGLEVLAFVVDDKAEWPDETRDDFELTALIRKGTVPTPVDLERVNANRERLDAHKTWLNGRAIRRTFVDPNDLRGHVSDALREWRERHPEWLAPRGAGVSPAADPTKYLTAIREACAYIDIRGLQVGTGRAQRFGIEELYMALATGSLARERSAPSEESEGEGLFDAKEAQERPLHEALTEPRLVVVGDPGAGKSTFLRRIGFAIALDLLGESPGAVRERLDLDEVPFPVLVRLSDLADHIARTREGPGSEQPTTEDSPSWLAHFLAAHSDSEEWELDDRSFRSKLDSGDCLVMLDGLDEVPDRKSRERVASLVEKLATAKPDCRIVVTSRPGAFEGNAVLPGFATVRIAPLDDDATELFLARWSQALHADTPGMAERYRAQLLGAVTSRPEIRHLARNPVMLTALAVVHWHEKHLPEQRAELYHSIVTWLSRSREDRPGRDKPERCLAVLQELALAMHRVPEGRAVQVSRRWAAEAVAGEFGGPEARESIARAEAFLEAEELDSGLVVKRGTDLRFWHLTFQEYLAARAIAARSETEQRALLGEGDGIHRAEWREVLLLLAGVLHGQGRQKVDGLVAFMLDRVSDTASLADVARCAGLIGAVVRDLRPLDYVPGDPRYETLLERAMGIFDRDASAGVFWEWRIPAADAIGLAGDPRLAPNNPDRWIEIPPGRFIMGAQSGDFEAPGFDEDARDNESPVREVSLDGFCIGRYAVTVAEYGRFVAQGGYDNSDHWFAGGFGNTVAPEDWAEQQPYPSRPVVGVSWYEAAAYADWAGCRLPTEAEWERAARGTSGRHFPWGDAEPTHELLNFNLHVGHPTPVGVYPAGSAVEGSADVAGNVLEWCWDWYENGAYSQSPVNNPAGPDKGVLRVIRGGSWGGDHVFARCVIRNGSYPDLRLNRLGFRVLCSSTISER